MNATYTLKRLCAVALASAAMLTAPLAHAAEGVVNTKSLVLRKSASTSSKALQTLDRGDSIDIISSKGSWYKVSYGKYTGYVQKKYVKAGGKVNEDKTEDKKTNVKENSASGNGMEGIDSIKDIGSVPGTCHPGDSGRDVKKLQQALTLKGFYSGKIDGVYGKGTTNAVKAFQKKNKLSRDGIAGKMTIKTLFDTKNGAADEKKTKTESLKWFGNENVIPKGATFTIKDCATGRTFKAVRWSGSNHIDAEPASKDDTADMKKIYGGSWSWRRRPILVKYDGHVYAASMNGMPHGTQTISNGFEGHFCIHFTGSKTHGTKKVDKDHQNAVQTAMKYSW